MFERQARHDALTGQREQRIAEDADLAREQRGREHTARLDVTRLQGEDAAEARAGRVFDREAATYNAELTENARQASAILARAMSPESYDPEAAALASVRLQGLQGQMVTGGQVRAAKERGLNPDQRADFFRNGRAPSSRTEEPRVEDSPDFVGPRQPEAEGAAAGLARRGRERADEKTTFDRKQTLARLGISEQHLKLAQEIAAKQADEEQKDRDREKEKSKETASEKARVRLMRMAKEGGFEEMGAQLKEEAERYGWSDEAQRSILSLSPVYQSLLPIMNLDRQGKLTLEKFLAFKGKLQGMAQISRRPLPLNTLQMLDSMEERLSRR